MLLKDIERFLQDQKVVNEVVYDLDDVEEDVTMVNNSECSNLSRDQARYISCHKTYIVLKMPLFQINSVSRKMDNSC